MIPKIIHYCWYGKNPKSDIIIKCIDSWKIYCYDYTIIEWNEINSALPLEIPFVRKAYEDKKWAFVSDYMRYLVVKNYGGIYLDTDILLIKPIDALLQKDIFFCYEDVDNNICSGVFGAVKDHPYLNYFLEYYCAIKVTEEFKLVDYVIPKVLNHIYYSNDSNKVMVYPYHLFYAMPYKKRYENYNKYIQDESLGVHIWTATWRDKTATFYLKERFILKSFKRFLEHLFIEFDLENVKIFLSTIFSYYARRIYKIIDGRKF
jgi:mannosyltransferase OCH1-like enzyme